MGPSSVGESSGLTVDSGSVSTDQAKRSGSHGSRRTRASASRSSSRFHPTLTPTVVEVTDDAKSNQEIPPKPSLTSKNLHKHQEGQIEPDPEEGGWEPPSTTVDERLLQARNFLSDEDPDSQRDFAKRLEAIGNYLRKLANEKVPCDIKVYKEVQDMLRVHQSRMNQQNGQIWPPFEERLLPRQSVRLILFDMDDRAQLRGAPLRDDHLPFTIKRPVDHDAFIETLRADTPRGQALRKIENDAYSQILSDPSLVREKIGEENQQTEDERFNTRATNRGRKRAAVQIALRSFATNHEQHVEGGWKHRVLRMPSAPHPEPSDPVMAITAEGGGGSDHDDSLEWTKKVLAFQNSVNISSQTRDAGQPSQIRGVIQAACQARFTFLATHLFNLFYNSPISRTDSEDDTRYFGEEFIEKINESGLPSPLPVQDQVREVTEYCDSRGWFLEDRLTEYANLDLNDTEQLEHILAETMQLHRQIQNEQFDPTAPTIAPKSAKAKGKQRENAAQGQREQALQELAEPLNGTNGLPSYTKAIDLLTNRILQENYENRPSSTLDYDSMWSFASDQPAQSKKKRFFSRGQRPTNQNPPSDVFPGKRIRATDAPPTERPSKRPQQQQQLQQHHHSSPSSTHPHPSSPGPTAPPHSSSRSSTPELGRGNLMPPEMQEFDVAKHGEVLENAPDAKERQWPGGEVFPFAETGFLGGVGLGGGAERDLVAGSPPAPASALAPPSSLALNIPPARFPLPKPSTSHPANPPPNPTAPPLLPLADPRPSRSKALRLFPRPELVVGSDGLRRPVERGVGSGGVVWRDGEEVVGDGDEDGDEDGDGGDLYGVSY